MKATGTVYVVGAGPGEAGLLTLRGAELLARADVVLYDILVNPELLRLAPASAELICRGAESDPQALSREAAHALMLARAREGKCVVRLQGGDPYLFGRGSEEAETLAAAHVPFEVVPGVSSIIAGPNYAGIPLTHRAHCSSFTVLAGPGGPTGPAAGLDSGEIARIPGTKVLLMGPDQMRDLAQSLVAHGMAGNTPVAVVQNAAAGGQRSVEGTLETIAGQLAEQHFAAPAIMVIGDVVKLRKKLNWRENRPLFGQRIVVTRARDQAGPLTRQLAELGADVLEIPAIKIGPPTDRTPLLEAMETLGEYDWLVFTSANGVTTFFDYFFKAFPDMRDLGAVRLAAVGPGTAAKLQEFHLKVDVMPKEALGRKVADALAAYQSIENVKILLLRAEKANPDLPKALEGMGAIVDDVACYQTLPETEDRNGAAERLAQEGADWITLTSGSTVEHFHARFNLPSLLQRFPRLKLASIGPETSQAITALGLQPTVEARQHTIDGLVKTLLAAAKTRH